MPTLTRPRAVLLGLACALAASCVAEAGEELALDEATPGAPVAPAPATPAPPAPAPPGLGSRCLTDAAGAITCTYQTIVVGGREVLHQVPLGDTPTGGWPVVIIYQGSFFAPVGMWSATPEDLAGVLGTVTQTRTIGALLDAGFAVITPPADLNALAWDTNLPPWLLPWAWPQAPDHGFLLELFAAVEDGRLGPLSATRWFATGVSSGGYMTSRMAVSYPGRFRALVVAAASYATCGGPACLVPAALPADHPPTRFLHGGRDPLVPVATMHTYRERLAAMGVTSDAIVDPGFRHGWIPAAPGAIVDWFQRFDAQAP